MHNCIRMALSTPTGRCVEFIAAVRHRPYDTFEVSMYTLPFTRPALINPASYLVGKTPDRCMANRVSQKCC